MPRCVPVALASVMLFSGLVTTLCGARPALADQSVHAVGTVTTGFTNNILGAPDTEERTVESDGFATLEPGVVFAYEKPRFRAEMSYRLSARLFFRNSAANSFSNFVNVIGSTDINETTQLGFGASASAGRINALNNNVDNPEVGQLPNGDISFARIVGNQSISKQLSELWTIRQNFVGDAFTPTDETTSVNTNWSLGGGLALERLWKTQQGTASFEGRYIHNERIDENGDRLDPDRQIVVGPRARWLWDINAQFSTSVGAGVVRVFTPDDFSTGFYQPVVSAQVSYLKERSLVTLGYVHDVENNSLIGQTSTVDRVSLRGDYPTTELLKDSKVSGTIAVQRAQFVNVESEMLERSTKQGTVVLGAFWQQYEGMTWAALYQYTKQDRDLPVLGSSQDFSQHSIQIALTVRYPDRQAVVLPKQRGARVDRANEQEEPQQGQGAKP